MKRMILKTRDYTIVILKVTQNANEKDTEKIVWEHARRNFSLREEGTLSIACPISDGTEVKGIGIFTTNEEVTKRIMDDDPAVKAGIFTYETHPCRSFRGICCRNKKGFSKDLKNELIGLIYPKIVLKYYFN